MRSELEVRLVNEEFDSCGDSEMTALSGATPDLNPLAPVEEAGIDSEEVVGGVTRSVLVC